MSHGDDTLDESEESVILAYADTSAGHHIGTSLADENSARLGESARGDLDTKILWIAIPAVFSCAC